MPTLSGVAGTRRHTLADYQRHLELYGSECLLETAAGDMDEKDLGQLKALIDSTERTSRLHPGQWVHRGQEVRPCEECGLDLPKSASSRTLRHRHCAKKASRQRHRSVQPTKESR
jgi:hypothetical protein